MMITRPNAWVSVEDDPTTQLTYAPRVDPAPLTVSVPGRDPTLGSLVVVITNGTPADVEVSSVTFTIVVGTTGPEGPPLTPTTEGVKSLVSDTTNWSFNGPPSPRTSGTADYVLGPATGSTVKLAAGASVYVEIFDFQTVQVPSTSTITVAEAIGGGDPQFTNIGVSTFPDGFFFDGLTVNVGSGSALAPAAQVVNGTGVTLTWNSSVVDTKNQAVLWSSATGGQQHAIPTKLGEWPTPAGLTSDTVFVVLVTAQDVGGEPMTASLATAVSVQNPALVASSIQTGQSTVSGNETVGGTLTATGGIAANGGLTATAATVNGALNANGGLTTNAAMVNGALMASGGIAANGGITASAAAVNGALTASGVVNANGGLNATGLSVSGEARVTGFTTLSYLNLTRLFMNTDVMNSIYAINNSAQYPTGYFQNNVGRSGNQVTGVYAKVAQGSDWGLYTNGRSGSDNSAVTHVETRDGHRVVTSPLVLEAEVQVSGQARLRKGRATVELGADGADMILHGEEHSYRVLVTPTARCNGLAVTSKDDACFEVEELLDGDSDAEFDWLVIGRKRAALGSSHADVLPESLPVVEEPPPMDH
ncbi:MAG TPA: hypothetical protein VF517_18410 [Thermoleophilaceae bacterium]|jgi:hypothetical protein